MRLHVERSKAAQLALNGETKAGLSPRPYGVITQMLPEIPAGEIVLMRGQRTVKKGKDDVAVFDVLRRSDPTRPIAVPGNGVVLINSVGLFKDSGALLEEYNRRVRSMVDIIRRLLEVRPGLTISIEKVANMKV